MQHGKSDDDSQIMVALRPRTNAWLKRDESSNEFNGYHLSQYEPLDCSGDRSEAAEGLLS
jgi:hypothetical protein